MIGKILQSFKKTRYKQKPEPDEKIIAEGLPAIQKVLLGIDTDKKRHLLCYLDWLIDHPYYEQNLSDIETNELINLLQTLIVTQNATDVKKDALELLESYAWRPFPILEEHFDDIEDELKSKTEYIINIHRFEKIESVMEAECIRMYKDLKKILMLYQTKHGYYMTQHLQKKKPGHTVWLL